MVSNGQNYTLTLTYSNGTAIPGLTMVNSTVIITTDTPAGLHLVKANLDVPGLFNGEFPGHISIASKPDDVPSYHGGLVHCTGLNYPSVYAKSLTEGLIGVDFGKTKNYYNEMYVLCGTTTSGTPFYMTTDANGRVIWYYEFIAPAGLVVNQCQIEQYDIYVMVSHSTNIVSILQINFEVGMVNYIEPLNADQSTQFKGGFLRLPGYNLAFTEATGGPNAIGTQDAIFARFYDSPDFNQTHLVRVGESGAKIWLDDAAVVSPTVKAFGRIESSSSVDTSDVFGVKMSLNT